MLVISFLFLFFSPFSDYQVKKRPHRRAMTERRGRRNEMQLRKPMSQRNGIKLKMEGKLLLRTDRQSFGILCTWQKYPSWGHMKMWSMDRDKSLMQWRQETGWRWGSRWVCVRRMCPIFMRVRIISSNRLGLFHEFQGIGSIFIRTNSKKSRNGCTQLTCAFFQVYLQWMIFNK